MHVPNPTPALRAAPGRVALAALLALVALCALRPIWNIDVGWHLAVGRWILDTGRLPDTDWWSASAPAAPWRSFQWLWQVAAAWLDRVGGLGLLRAAHAAWVTGTFALAWVLLRRRGFGPAATLLLLAALLVVWQDRLRVRPHVVNLSGMLALSAALLRPTWRPWRGALVTAALTWLWAVLHMGGALLGAGAWAGVALALGLRGLLRGRRRTDLPVQAAALGALLGVAAAPGALATLGVMLAQHRGSMAAIDEWRAWWQALPDLALGRVQIAAVLAAWPVAAVAWFVTGVRAWRTRDARGLPLERVALAWVFLGLSFQWVRFSWLAVLALALLLAPRGDNAQQAPARVRPSLLWVSALLGMGLAFHHTTWGSWPTLGQALAARAQDIDERRFPVQETRLLVRAGIEARVALPAGWGGYVLYAGWPRLRVTVDGRMVCPPDVLATTEEIRAILGSGRGVERLPALYDRLPADLLLMPPPAFPGGDTGDWLPVVRSSRADLYVRRGPHLAEWGPAFDEAFRAMQQGEGR